VGIVVAAVHNQAGGQLWLPLYIIKGWSRSNISRALHFPITSLQSMRKIQAPNLRNGTIPISQQQFHYLSAKGDVVDKKASDIGCSSKSMYIKHLSAGWMLERCTSLRVPISPLGCLLSRPATHVQAGGQLGTPR
jgi:hypothetical protein